MPTGEVLLTLFLLTFLTYHVHGGEIFGSLNISNPIEGWRKGAVISLNGGEHLSYLDSEGRFAFYHVNAGLHTIDIHVSNYIFEPLLVEVTVHGFKAFIYPKLASRMVEISTPLVITPTLKVNYFKKREEFSLQYLFRNPMLLMLAFLVVMAFSFPRLLSSLDPEALVELNKTYTVTPKEEELKALRNPSEPKIKNKLN